MSQSKPLFTKLYQSLRPVIAATLFSFLFVGLASAATIGVGVGTGKIRLDHPIKPGLTYAVPSIAVFNNGDVETNYEMSVQYNERQPELKPKAEWIKFSPQKFKLSEGSSQEVKVAIHPSSSAKPGSYYAYLEAHPVVAGKNGQTALKIAAATKLYFKIEPANIWQRIYYAIMDFWNKHQSAIISVLVVVAISIIIFTSKKYIKIELKKK